MTPAPFPRCPHCGPHAWHGLPCKTPTAVHAHAKRTRCSCPTSALGPDSTGMDEFLPTPTTAPEVHP